MGNLRTAAGLEMMCAPHVLHWARALRAWVARHHARSKSGAKLPTHTTHAHARTRTHRRHMHKSRKQHTRTSLCKSICWLADEICGSNVCSGSRRSRHFCARTIMSVPFGYFNGCERATFALASLSFIALTLGKQMSVQRAASVDVVGVECSPLGVEPFPGRPLARVPAGILDYLLRDIRHRRRSLRQNMAGCGPSNAHTPDMLGYCPSKHAAALIARHRALSDLCLHLLDVPAVAPLPSLAPLHRNVGKSIPESASRRRGQARE